ncbi:GGDEF domain-containing protein [Arcobacter sp. YIC-80]|uniref:GGDEF domain-containing protein n=1 Tax=Arcobacter sp. YIC-80 TaxID=3376683 RepID=UPI0038513ADC
MSEKLREVTYLTVKNLKNNDIVLPGDYSKTFAQFAKELKVDIDNKNTILQELQYDTNIVDKIVKSTNENLDNIKESTKQAKVAIENKDGEALNSITNELSQMQKQIQFLQKELFSDSLTSAYNRKWFMDYFLENESFKESGKLCFIDLNKFKIINDTYGHLLGDQVLKYLVKFLLNELNHKGVDVVRYAGDEFMVLFTGDSLNSLDINKTMKETQEKLSKQKLKSAKVQSLQFSFSYGIVDFKKGDNISNILEQADELMYENKQKNR